MASLSVASRMAPEGAGRLKPLDKLFCFYSKTGCFSKPLANYCLKRLPMLYYECRRLNGLWSPFGIPVKMWGEGGKRKTKHNKASPRYLLGSRRAVFRAGFF